MIKKTINELNELELAVLDWISENTSNRALKSQLKTATLKKRSWTKVGFHVDIAVDRDCAEIDVKFPIQGPSIESPDIEHGGLSWLWGNLGYVDSIELVAYGSYFNEGIRQFTLSERL